MEAATERLSEHFTRAEMACPCCQRAPMNGDFMDRLEDLRRRYGRPMIINSGFRCASHNQNVSSTGANGPHTTGEAVDVKIAGAQAYVLLEWALQYRFSGIGVQQKGPHESRFLHLDTLRYPDYPRPRIWSY